MFRASAGDRARASCGMNSPSRRWQLFPPVLSAGTVNNRCARLVTVTEAGAWDPWPWRVSLSAPRPPAVQPFPVTFSATGPAARRCPPVGPRAGFVQTRCSQEGPCPGGHPSHRPREPRAIGVQDTSGPKHVTALLSRMWGCKCPSNRRGCVNLWYSLEPWFGKAMDAADERLGNFLWRVKNNWL